MIENLTLSTTDPQSHNKVRVIVADNLRQKFYLSGDLQARHLSAPSKATAFPGG